MVVIHVSAYQYDELCKKEIPQVPATNAKVRLQCDELEILADVT